MQSKALKNNEDEGLSSAAQESRRLFLSIAEAKARHRLVLIRERDRYRDRRRVREVPPRDVLELPL